MATEHDCFGQVSREHGFSYPRYPELYKKKATKTTNPNKHKGKEGGEAVAGVFSWKREKRPRHQRKERKCRRCREEPSQISLPYSELECQGEGWGCSTGSSTLENMELGPLTSGKIK